MPPNSTLIQHFLENSAAKYPGKTALVHEGRRTTYRELNSLANRFAGFLLENGLRPGDRVVLLLENCLEYIAAYYGILKAGAVAVPLSPELKSDTIGYSLKELEPRAVVVSARAIKGLLAVDLDACDIRTIILKGGGKTPLGGSVPIVAWEEAIHGADGHDPDMSFGDEALGSIIYTSGSTGKPKGVMLSHRNIVSNTLAICHYLEITADDIQMVVLPFFYVMGKSLLNTHIAVGGTVVLNNKFAFPAAVLKEMVAERVTAFAGVPSTYAYLLHRSPLPELREQLSSLRYCTQAGGHMARELKEGLRRVLPAQTKIYIMYGATEASARLSYLDPERYEDRMDSIGRPIPGVHFRIVSPTGEEVSPGETGELVAAGPNIMEGYWRDPEASERVLRENWYHTGDLAYRDKDGFYFVIGRKDDQLKSGGHRINPQEIEDVLLESGLLIEAIVLGIADALLGKRIVALAVPRTEEVKEKVMDFCHRRLPKYKIPGDIHLVKTLPKNVVGKVDRERCRELIGCEQNNG